MGWDRPATGGRPPGRFAWAFAVLSAAGLVAALGAVGLRALDGEGPLALPAFAGAPADLRARGVDPALGLMTRALRAHDERAYLAVVDGRDAALLARQRTLFRNLQALPLKDPLLRWDGRRSQPSEHPERYPAGAVTVVADLTFLLDGWDDENVDDVVVLTLAPVGRGWLVVGDTDDAGTSPARRYLEPWTVGVPLGVERRGHVLVVGQAAQRAELRRLADRLEQVAGDVRERWAEPSWNGRVVAYAVTDPRFVQAWFAGQAATGPPDRAAGGQPTWEARVGSLSRSAPGDDAENGPPRLVVTPYVLGRVDARVLSTLRHEVTHVATARLGRPVPGWLAEGAAEYTGFRLGGARVDAVRTFAAHGLTEELALAMRGGSWQPRLLDDRDQFYSGTAEVVSAGYLDAWIACLYVADRYGDAALRRLYDTAASQPTAASWDAVDDSALREVLQTDHAGLLAAVRGYGLALYRRATGA
ncbi:MAG TPA: hypothetical protein VI248_25835 [Kineosporiaceae bacterium]